MNDSVLPELEPMLTALRAAPPFDFGDLAALRAMSDAQVEAMAGLFVPEAPSVVTTTTQVPREGSVAIELRVHRPEGDGPFPILVYLHGGGWILGNARQVDRICRRFAERLGWIVAAVDYRLAPEHPFPTPLEDCHAALVWTAANAAAIGGDPHAIAIGGQSAGGNLAAAVALVARDRGGPALVAQWLDIPGVDLTLEEDDSIRAFGRDFGLNVADMTRTIALYVTGEQVRHAYASPLFASSHANLPPAVITVAGCDPLRDQGERYAAALKRAGVPVRLSRWDGHLHATMSLTTLHPSSGAYEEEVVDALGEFGRLAARTR